MTEAPNSKGRKLRHTEEEPFLDKKFPAFVRKYPPLGVKDITLSNRNMSSILVRKPNLPAKINKTDVYLLRLLCKHKLVAAELPPGPRIRWSPFLGGFDGV